MRALPHSEEAERVTLGAILNLSSGSIVDEMEAMLQADDFYLPAHKVIWKAVKVLRMEETAVDIKTVYYQLEYTKDLARAGGLEYLSEVADMSTQAANGVHYAGIVKEYSTLRHLHQAGESIKQSVSDPNMTVAEKVEAAHKLVSGCVIHKIHGSSPSEIDLTKAGEQFLPLMIGGGRLSERVIGLPVGQLTTIEAKTGVGKSMTMQQIGLEYLMAGRKVRHVTVADLSDTQLAMRYLYMLCGMSSPPSAYESDLMSDDSRRRFAIWQKAVAKWQSWDEQLEIYDGSAPGMDSTVQGVCAWLTQRQEKAPAHLIIIDYVQQLGWRGKQTGRVEDATNVCQALGKWAGTIRDGAIIAGSQLSKDGMTAWAAELQNQAAIRINVSRDEDTPRGKGERLTWQIVKHRFAPAVGYTGNWIRGDRGLVLDE